MCTHPLQINRSDVNGHVRTDVVPCGKCAECICRKQADFSALATLEAKRSQKVHFVTLTYDNVHVPIMYSDKRFNLVKMVNHDDHAHHSLVQLCASSNGCLIASQIDGADVCPSLNREDFRLFLKRCRTAYNRQFGYNFSLRIAGFGEYGGKTFRPHYHFLFYDAESSVVNFIASRWREEFGFADVKFVNSVNKDGSPGFVKVSKYISKYIAKPKKDFPWLLDGLCEPPSQIELSALWHRYFRHLHP